MLFFSLVVLLLLRSSLGFILPLNKNTGEVDLQSVVMHITLIEQKLNTLEPEFIILKSKVADLEAKLAASRQQEKTTTSGLKALQTQISLVRNKTVELSQNININQTHISPTPGGSTFIRWGRTACPSGNEAVYKGYAAGRSYAFKAGAGNMLCMSDKPIYDNQTSGSPESKLYGTEYETSRSAIFTNLHNDDMPCVVCRSQTKYSSVMVPGRNQCFPGWNMEYSGFLMGPLASEAASQYICVDIGAEAEPGSQDNKDGNTLFLVGSMCGSLRCPPYKNNWGLTCAVCSR